MTIPDEALVDRIDELGASPWSGTAYRHTRAGRDPLSGEGASRMGGRWNPPGRPTVYLAQPARTCIAEFDRMAAATSAPPASLMARGWELHTIEVRDLPVLDLTSAEALDHVSIQPEDIADEDWSACQAVGEAAHFLALAGVAAPSATGSGIVLAAFEDRVAPGQLSFVQTDVLDDHTYRSLRG